MRSFSCCRVSRSATKRPASHAELRGLKQRVEGLGGGDPSACVGGLEVGACVAKHPHDVHGEKTGAQEATVIDGLLDGGVTLDEIGPLA
mgnify:CR=1 FL=1